MKASAAVVCAVAAGAIAICVARKAFFVVRVDGTSMAPTFRPGEAVLAVRRGLRPRLRPDDLVVCRLPAGTPGPDGLLIKRVVAVGGDDMPGQVVVHGDGPNSYDSRHFGPIPLGDVVGHVVARLSLDTD